jgi:ABC-type antimicrobial peptide transport system permease subunit
MFVPLSYNLRSLFVRRSATLLTVLGIGATVAIVSGVIALQQGFQSMFVAGGRDDVALFLRPGANSEGDSQFSRDRGLKLIKSVPEIEIGPAGPIASMEAYLAVLLSPVRGGVTNVPLRGVQPMTFEIRRNELKIIDGVNFTPGNDELIVGKRLVDRIANCRIGDVIQLNKTPFRVVGVFDHPGQFGGEIWGDLDRLLSAMGRYGPNRVIAQLKPGTDIGSVDPMAAYSTEDPEDGIAAILDKNLAPGEAQATLGRMLAAYPNWRDLSDLSADEINTQFPSVAQAPKIAPAVVEYLQKARSTLDPKPGSMAARLLEDPEVPAKVFSEQQFLASQTVVLTIMLVGLGLALAVIMGLAAIFTATNTMLSALAARAHEIGILLAMGYRPVPIFVSFMFEALVLGLSGGVIGALMALPFNGVKAGTMNFQTFTEMAFAFRVTPVVLGVAIALSLMLGLLGGAWPAWRAARLKPTIALRQG